MADVPHSHIKIAGVNRFTSAEREMYLKKDWSNLVSLVNEELSLAKTPPEQHRTRAAIRMVFN